MNNIIYSIPISNIINILLGITFGFFIMIILSCAIISKMLSKSNEDKHIRNISNKSYVDFYSNNTNIKDKIISSVIFEVKEVSTLIHPDKKHPIYELSINDLLNGLLIIQKRLKKITNHPLCYDIKHIHISKILSIEENFSRPFVKIYKKKSTKVIISSYKIVKFVINLFNPIFYMKKVLSYIMMKKGRKEIILIFLDFVGNTTHQIYSKSNIENKHGGFKLDKSADWMNGLSSLHK